MLTGQRPGNSRRGLVAWANDDLPPGWRPGKHHLDLDHPILRYEHDDGRRVTVARAAQWFGEGDHSPADCEAAWDALTDAVAKSFDRGGLWGTPASTGRYLLMRSLPHGHEYPVLDDDTQALIRSTAGQGRIWGRWDYADLPDELPGLYEYDGRVMYSALCAELPTGVPRHVGGVEFDPYVRARWHVMVKVPRDWDERCDCGAPGHPGIGLLPHRDDGRRWRYPAEPGAVFNTWVDGSELRIAAEHGWTFHVAEALIWPERIRCVEKWAANLVRIRQDAEGVAAPIGPMLRTAARNIVLHGIGALHGARHTVTGSTHIDQPDAVPEDVESLQRTGDHLIWATHTAQAWPEMAHPEWSAAIWARGRSRVLSGPGDTGILHVPADHVVAVRTDGIYLTHPADWPDDGRPGRFRRKVAINQPVPTPRSQKAVLRLRQKGQPT